MPARATGASRRRVWQRGALAAAIAAVAAPYLIALGSPMRLFPDSVTYLGIADGTYPGSHQIYPPGYPGLLRLAQDIGLGSPAGFVAINLVALAIAVACLYRLYRDPLGLTPAKAALVCFALVLAHTVSQLTPVVLSDIPYLAGAMVCLLALSAAERESGRRRWLRLLGAVVAAAAAISIRVQGVALVPAIVFVLIGQENLIRAWRVTRRNRARTVVVCVAAAVALIAVSVVVIRASPYANHIADTWRTGGSPGAFVSHLGTEAKTKLMSVAELATQVNCCRRLSGTFSFVSGAIVPALVVIGVAVLGLIALGWFSRRRFGAIEVFTLSSGAVILVYAGATPRFWIGALPFLIVYALFGLERLARWTWARPVIALYGVVFALIGMGWLVQSVRLSTAGRNFPGRWASEAPDMGTVYRVAFDKISTRGYRPFVHQGVQLLRRYEPLAQGPRR